MNKTFSSKCFTFFPDDISTLEMFSVSVGKLDRFSLPSIFSPRYKTGLSNGPYIPRFHKFGVHVPMVKFSTELPPFREAMHLFLYLQHTNKQTLAHTRAFTSALSLALSQYLFLSCTHTHTHTHTHFRVLNFLFICLFSALHCSKNWAPLFTLSSQ